MEVDQLAEKTILKECEIYNWEVTQNPDGSSELVIQVYPFHYQPTTTNVEWYDTFTFDVDKSDWSGTCQ